MKKVLALIEKKQRDFAQLPLLQFLRDSSIDPRQRLSFAPCFAPFVMGFGELNRTVFREEGSDDPIQLTINQHSREDDSHWIWFLEDLQKLEFDLSLSLSDALRFLWSDKTHSSRHMVYELYRHTYQAPPIQKLVVIEAVEATADIFLSATVQAARDLQGLTNREYRYFGNLHHAIDTGHSLHLSETQQFIESLQLTENSEKVAFECVEAVFQLFTDFFDVIFNVVKTPAIATSEQTIASVSVAPKIFNSSQKQTTQFTNLKEEATSSTRTGKRLGTYLVEAGLLTIDRLELALNEQEKTEKRLGEVLSNQGWVNHQTVEYLMEKVVLPERELILERSLSLAR